jgi:hypothetical protein
MDIDALRARLPAGDEFLRYSPQEKKECVERFIQVILEAIDADGRQPDGWEARDLAHALGYMLCHWYHAALVCASRALTPLNQRSPIAFHRSETAPTASQLRRALDYVSGMPG